MIDRREYFPPAFLLALLLVVVALVYWPGLTGGFVLDDYGQIIINDTLALPKNWTLPDVLAALASSESGPFGRPVAMATLVVQRTLYGLDPWYFKLFNLAIHLVNTVLVFLLARCLYALAFPGLQGGECRLFYSALLAAALWGLHPFNLTGVLYVVQRMTSLSSTFSLVALLCYSRFRQEGLDTPRFLACVAGFLLSFAAAVLTKETALLIPVFCFVVEFLFFRFRKSDGTLSKLAVAGYAAIFLLPALWLIGKVVFSPGGLGQMYGGRPFTLEQRLYTQLVVLWFYLRNIFLPDIRSMGLHHDDFPVFSDPLSEPLIGLSLLGHLLMLYLAWKARERYKLVSFGILFFYAGHLLESTFWPLELVYEHRNYLPTVGFAIMAGWYLPAAVQSKANASAAVLLSATVVLFFAGATMIRASHWGDPVTFAMVEAEKHPQSGRANFDAARELLVLMLRLKHSDPNLEQMVGAYLEKSMGKGMVTVEPYLVAYQAKAQLGMQVPDDMLDKFRNQLSSGVMTNAMYGFAQGLLSLSRFETPPLNLEQQASLYEAALNNPRVGGSGRGHVLTAYSIFAAEAEEDLEKSYQLAMQAVSGSPGFIPFKQNAVIMAFASGRKDEALQLLSEIDANDTLGMYRSETARLVAIMKGLK